MSKPCENCDSDLKVCASCDFYNNKYIEKTVLEQIQLEITNIFIKYNLSNTKLCFEILKIFNKRRK